MMAARKREGLPPHVYEIERRYRAERVQGCMRIMSPRMPTPEAASAWMIEHQTDQRYWKVKRRPETMWDGLASALIRMWEDGEITCETPAAVVLFDAIAARRKARGTSPKK